MKIEMPFDRRLLCASLPDACVLGTLHAGALPHPADETMAVEAALRAPIGSPPLEELVRPGEKIAVITSDITRPMPSDRALPPLLRALKRAGVHMQDVTIYFALGSHRRQTEAEMRRLVGDAVYDMVRCVDSDTNDTVFLGVTEAGTPVEIARGVAQADRRICLGNIEYHYFAGFSGGAKAIVPGVASLRTIQANHSLMARPGAESGELEKNPVRRDLEQAARLCGADFILNVVLDESLRIVRAFAGDMIAAHRAGCEFLRAHYAAPIEKLADLVVVSQGGAPKDVNLYQAQKAISNAERAVRPGGVILLTASCGEGFGNAVFAQWLQQAACPQDVIDRLKKGFVLGGHKAAALARTMCRAEIWAVTDMSVEQARAGMLHPYESLQSALDAAYARFGKDMTVWLMPHGGSTLPEYQE